MDDNTIMNSTDTSRFTAAKNATIWDPRADLDDDGDVDSNDQTLFDAKDDDWGANPTVTVAQAFSDVGNPYMFQGVPHFALDTAAAATSGKLMLNHHRARFEDVAVGRWVTRDPVGYNEPIAKKDGRNARGVRASYVYLVNNPLAATDALGLIVLADCYENTPLDPSNPLLRYPGLTFDEAVKAHEQTCYEDEQAFCDQIFPEDPESPEEAVPSCRCGKCCGHCTLGQTCGRTGKFVFAGGRPAMRYDTCGCAAGSASAPLAGVDASVLGSSGSQPTTAPHKVR
jgi:hypothetical protein